MEKQEGNGEADVAIVSSRTVDRLPRPGGKVEELPGGPATYIAEALDRLGRAHTMLTGDVVPVDVLTGTDGDQQYLIPPIPPIPLPPRIDAAATIVSPIMREVDPRGFPPVAGLLVIDLQGFVREPNVPTGEARNGVDVGPLIARAHTVKATPRELELLSPETRSLLDHVTLLLTRGAQGALVLREGRSTAVPTHPVPARHTIGAGDLFLASYVDALLSGFQPEEAAGRAARTTEAFLRERK